MTDNELSLVVHFKTYPHWWGHAWWEIWIGGAGRINSKGNNYRPQTVSHSGKQKKKKKRQQVVSLCFLPKK
jgi:hypothetical protein